MRLVTWLADVIAGEIERGIDSLWDSWGLTITVYLWPSLLLSTFTCANILATAMAMPSSLTYWILIPLLKKLQFPKLGRARFCPSLPNITAHDMSRCESRDYGNAQCLDVVMRYAVYVSKGKDVAYKDPSMFFLTQRLVSYPIYKLVPSPLVFSP